MSQTSNTRPSILERMGLCKSYLSEDAAKKLKLYKYAGGDNGILYKFFYNPVALKLVSYLPETLAPNVITLIGFLFTLIPCILLFSLYGIDFEGPVSSWWCYLEAVSYLIYRMLDEMDGKQARKTGNSSPIGLLFDHGCDSFTVAMLALMIMKMIQVGNNYIVLIGLVASTQSFYFCTLEEYYIGGLFLGLGNAVTDGSIVLIGLFLFCGVAGTSLFTQTVQISIGNEYFDIEGSQIIAFALLLSQILYVLYNIFTIISHQRKDISAEQRQLGEPLVYLDLLQQILAYYLAFYVIYLSSFATVSPIIYDYPLLPGLLFSFIYTHNTINIQVCHVTKQKYNPWTKVLVFNLVVLLVYYGLSFKFMNLVSPYYVFGGLVAITGIAQWHFILSVINQMAKSLGIRIFKTKPISCLNPLLSEYRQHLPLNSQTSEDQSTPQQTPQTAASNNKIQSTSRFDEKTDEQI